MIDNNVNITEQNDAKAYKSKSILNKTLIITLIVAFFAFCVILISFLGIISTKKMNLNFQVYELNNLKKNFDRIEEAYDKKEKEYNEVKYKIDLMDKEIALVNNDENVYHTYDCALFYKSSFHAYDIQSAKNLGCRPCGLCHK